MDFLPLVIIMAAIIAAGIIIVTIKSKYGKDPGFLVKNEPKVMNVSLNKEFLNYKERHLIKKIVKCLPEDFIVYPRVSLAALLKPKSGDKVGYNAIMNEYVDYCVFLKSTMEPVVAIDAYESSSESDYIQALPPNVENALKTAGLKLVRIMVQEVYNLDQLRYELMEAMPNHILALLKEIVKRTQL